MKGECDGVGSDEDAGPDYCAHDDADTPEHCDVNDHLLTRINWDLVESFDGGKFFYTSTARFTLVNVTSA